MKDWIQKNFVTIGVGVVTTLVGIVLGYTIVVTVKRPNTPTSTPTPMIQSAPPITPTPIQSTDKIKFRLRVLDNENKPLKNVKAIIVSSSPTESEETNDYGYAEFEVPIKSSQVKLSLIKEGYNTFDTSVDISTYVNTTKEYNLKLKKK
jgi:hypothetical protein